MASLHPISLAHPSGLLPWLARVLYTIATSMNTRRRAIHRRLQVARRDALLVAADLAKTDVWDEGEGVQRIG